jgi:hypothetical protein
MDRLPPLIPLPDHECIARAEPVLAGTLCLMSAFRTTACPLMAGRIATNLALLADHPDLSPEFRRVCRRLIEQWNGGQASRGAQDESPAASRLH